MSDIYSKLIQSYYRNFLKIELSEDDISYLVDYSKMSLKLGSKLKLKYSKNTSFKKLHDNILDEYNEQQTKKIIRNNKNLCLPKDCILANLKLSSKYIPINNINLLLMEAELQHHCILTRVDSIRKGKSSCYTTNYLGNKYSFEVCINNRRIFLKELKGRYNQAAPEKLKTEIEKELEKETERIFQEKSADASLFLLED